MSRTRVETCAGEKTRSWFNATFVFPPRLRTMRGNGGIRPISFVQSPSVSSIRDYTRYRDATDQSLINNVNDDDSSFLLFASVPFFTRVGNFDGDLETWCKQSIAINRGERIIRVLSPIHRSKHALFNILPR